MTISKETLSDYKEKYEKAERLVEDDSKLDPETEPFRSHYAARAVLLELQNNLKNSLNDLADCPEAADDRRTLTHILGYMLKDTGRICVWTEEFAAGEQHLRKCLELLAPHKLEPGCVNAYLGALNQIGILWSSRQNSAESHRYLLEANDLYTQFKASAERALTVYDIFALGEEVSPGKGADVLEKTHTLTLYYLAQVVGAMGDMHASAVYCHTTLKRQLEFRDYEPIDWALNSATLSQYFFNHNRNTESRHHLAAAQYMLDEHEQQMYTAGMTAEERAAVQETFHHRSADVMRCWAKFGLHLLLESKNRLMEEQGGAAANSPQHQKTALCRFESLKLDEYERIITDQWLLMFDDAKPVFLATQTWLNRAKEYYAPETEASEYAKIVQDLANAYKYLAFFDFDESNQCKMHKRRADLLEELLELLSETYYLSTCRELWYELGLAYAAMLDIKQDMAEKARREAAEAAPNPQALNKINMLCHKSIARFQSFCASYAVDKETLELKAGLTDDEMEPILFAYFECGRLYYKLSTPDRAQQVANTKNSLRFYQMLVDGCERNKTHEKRLKAEYGVCKEMTQLLPLKIKKLMDQTAV